MALILNTVPFSIKGHFFPYFAVAALPYAGFPIVSFFIISFSLPIYY